MAVCVLLLAAEAAAIHPHYLAYFNLASGGSRNGTRYLLDSNLDWGQDALKLRAYMRERNIASMPLRYFGSADLDYYGIERESLEDAVRSGRQGRVAISATALEMDLDLANFRKCRPVDRVGYSIYVFELNSAGCSGEKTAHIDFGTHSRSVLAFRCQISRPLYRLNRGRRCARSGSSSVAEYREPVLDPKEMSSTVRECAPFPARCLYCEGVRLVDLVRFELTTSSMPWKRAPNCATGPYNC